MSPEEWAFKISELIKECEKDGYSVDVTTEGDLTIWVDEALDPEQVASPIFITW
jgi:hypothetical protein